MSTQIDSLKEKLILSHQNLKNGLYEFLFRQPAPSYGSKSANYFVLGVAYLVGVFHWGWLLNYGRVQYKFMDWQKFFDYYGVIRKALAEGAIPYFMPYFHKGTNQFLAVPETDLSPTVLLLSFLSVEEFFFAQMIVVYSLGFIGCLWLKKRYQWSLFTFWFFFLIFNLNGHIVSHLAIGHWPWVSYFLFSFFIGWVLRLAEGEVSPWHGTQLAWVLFVIILLGGIHPFVWCLLFLFFLCLFQRQYWKPIFTGVALTMIFSSYRIIPAAITYFGYKNQFAWGFPSLTVFLKSLIYIKGQEDMFIVGFGKNNTAHWWEVDHFIGVVGLVTIVAFGIFLRLKEKNTWGISDYRVLNGPMLILTLLSFGSLYELFTHIPIPFISVERVSSRFLILPLLMLLAISCIWMQQMFNRSSARWSVMLLALGGIFVEGFLLFKHSALWQVKLWEIKMSKADVIGSDAISAWAKSVEWLYIPAVQVSYLISLTAILIFVAVVLNFKRKNPVSEKEA